jgi:lipopolysaccharide assembly protein B
MELDIGWILIGLPAAFVLGWLASRLDLRQMRLEGRRAPKAYFKGLNHLLNEQQDQAIDAFIEAVQNDPDTSELHFALGNLFRRRGEYERAVRVHEHLIARGDLVSRDRNRAQHALALDFLKAGLLDRAAEALGKLEGTEFQTDARHALLSIFEKTRNWKQADVIARKLQLDGQGNFDARVAHYRCESAQELVKTGDFSAAKRVLSEAARDFPLAPRPPLDLSRLLVKDSAHAEAWDVLATAAVRCPESLPLFAATLSELAMATGHAVEALDTLQTSYQRSPSLDVLEGIVQLDGHLRPSSVSHSEWYVQHLEREPSLVAAAKWIAGEKLEHEQFHPLVQRALDHAVKPLTRFRCAACGFSAAQHFWQCPGCQTWDSYPPRRVEEL